MNRAVFIWDVEAVEGLGAIRIEVDGHDLADLIRTVELPYAKAEGNERIAGAYAGLRPWQLKGSMLEHFLGAEGSDLVSGPQNKTVLLGCECGEPGCWPLMAQVDVRGEEVIWSSFEQPHRRDRWSHEEFGELRFDRAEYEDALTAVAATIPDRPSLPD